MLTKAKQNRYNYPCLFGVILVTLQFNVHEVLASPAPLRLGGQFELHQWLDNRAGITDAAPLNVRLTARPEAGNVIVEGEAETQLTVPCSRCLEPCGQHVRVHIHETFTRTPLSEGSDADAHFTEDPVIDVLPYVAESILLEMPFVPLCREDCAGLCPQCGANRNVGSCSCREERVDPRLEDLQKFFDKQ